jgi:hypothetical protein
MANDCCALVEELAQNFQDEIDANAEYTKLAKGLENSGIRYHQIVETIAADEFKHLVLLHGIVSILNSSCDCEFKLPPERATAVKEAFAKYGLKSLKY